MYDRRGFFDLMKAPVAGNVVTYLALTRRTIELLLMVTRCSRRPPSSVLSLVIVISCRRMLEMVLTLA